MDFITIILVLAVVVFAAHIAVEDKLGTSSPGLIIKQIAHWLSFGLLFTKDLILTTTTEVQLLNAQAKLEVKESGSQVDLGWIEGAQSYKNSDIRKTVTDMRKKSSDKLKTINKSLADITDNL